MQPYRETIELMCYLALLHVLFTDQTYKSRNVTPSFIPTSKQSEPKETTDIIIIRVHFQSDFHPNHENKNDQESSSFFHPRQKLDSPPQESAETRWIKVHLGVISRSCSQPRGHPRLGYRRALFHASGRSRTDVRGEGLLVFRSRSGSGVFIERTQQNGERCASRPYVMLWGAALLCPPVGVVEIGRWFILCEAVTAEILG